MAMDYKDECVVDIKAELKEINHLLKSLLENMEALRAVVADPYLKKEE